MRADRLGEALGLASSGSRTTRSATRRCRSRIAWSSVALSKAKELGFDTVACASTGNLANSTAANAAAAGLRCYVLIPHDLEAGKVLGTSIYGAQRGRASTAPTTTSTACARRSPSATAGRSSTSTSGPTTPRARRRYGYEIPEQLGWRTPAHVVVPMASGSLLTKIGKSIDEFTKLGLVEARGKTKLYGAQASGCGPIAEAVLAGRDAIKPVKNAEHHRQVARHRQPGRRPYAAQAIRASGGYAAAVSDEEIVDGIQLLAETEGIFTETAGGVTVRDRQAADRRGAHPARRADGPLHHRQRLEDAGAAGRRAARAAADRAAHRRVRERIS